MNGRVNEWSFLNTNETERQRDKRSSLTQKIMIKKTNNSLFFLLTINDEVSKIFYKNFID